MNPFKLHVKIADHEFTGEGEEPKVNESFRLWLDAIQQSKQSRQTPPDPPGNGGDDIDRELLERAFDATRRDEVSLHVLPNGENQRGEAAILILYGFHRFKEQADISAFQLMEGLRESGLSMERIDRTLANMDQYVRKGGRKRGTRYSLTNPGKAHAVMLLKNLFS